MQTHRQHGHLQPAVMLRTQTLEPVDCKPVLRHFGRIILVITIALSAAIAITLPVAAMGSCIATPDDGITLFTTINADAIQDAIDVAMPGATVKIAGTCEGTQNIGGSDQQGFIDKNLLLIGGYDGTTWTTSNPVANPTTLDALSGGRIFLITDTVTVGVENLTLQYGSSLTQTSGSGGAIKAIGATVHITNSIVISSESRSDGGGVTSDSTLTIQDSLFEFNFAGDDGGALDPDGPVSIDNSIIRNNFASGDGGGIDLDDAFSISNSFIYSNSADVAGGGINIEVGSGLITNTEITSNTTFANFFFGDDAGGGLFVGDAMLEIAHSRVVSNSAAFGQGGGIAGLLATITLNNVTVDDNFALFGGGIGAFDSTLNLNESVVSNNNSAEPGGGIFIADNLPTFGDSITTINNSDITNNTALDPNFGAGGGVHVDGGMLTVTGSNIDDNTGNGDTDFSGGGIYIEVNTSVNISGDSTVSRNAAPNGYGGGILSYGQLTVISTTIDANTALDGAGIDIEDDPSGPFLPATLALLNSQVSNNIASDFGGGGIYNYDSAITITNSQFNDNTAANGVGGGIIVSGTMATATIESSSFTRNSSIDSGFSVGFPSGGGLWINEGATANVSSTLFDSNVADAEGAAIAVEAGGILHLSNSTVRDGVAVDLGGGISLLQSTGFITDTTISGNETDPFVGGGPGGGIASIESGLSLYGSTINNNTALAGGGIYVESGTVSLANSTLSNNFADDTGGGLFASIGTVSLNNVTVYENEAFDGGGISNNTGDATINVRNSIVANSGGGDCVNVTALGNNLDSDGSCGFTRMADPLLAALADNGGATHTHALANNSPAAEYGDNATCEATDQRGVSRPQPASGSCDIGAYEIGYASLALTKTAHASDVAAGDQLTYTIAVENTGTIAATGITISDTISGGSYTINSVTLEPTQAGATLSTTPPTLASGLIISPSESVTLTVVVTTDGTYSGTITNTAALVSAETPIVPAATTSQTITTTAWLIDYAISAELVPEGNSATTPLTLTITRNDVPLTSSVLVTTTGNTATAGSDFTPLNGLAVTFAPNELSKTVFVQVNGDLLVEADETLTATLTVVDFGSVSVNDAEALIINDDFALVDILPASVTEGHIGTTDLVFSVVMTGEVDVPVVFTYVVTDSYFIPPFPAFPPFPATLAEYYTGTATIDVDYVSASGTITFSGSTVTETQLVTVTVNGERLVEDDETLYLAIEPSIMDGGSNSRELGFSPFMTGTIVNDDSALISIVDSVAGSESMSPFVFDVSLDYPVDRDVTVDLITSDLTAFAGEDYVALTGETVTFTAGLTTTQQVRVTINNDTKVEPDEFFITRLDNLFANGRDVSLSTIWQTGTITNDDSALVTLTAGPALAEGTATDSKHVFTATLNVDVAGGFTLNYTTDDNTALAGSDYVDNDGSLSFAGNAGETQTFTVTVRADTTVEADETFTATLTSVSGSALSSQINLGAAVVGTITNDDSALVSIGDVTASEADGLFGFDVLLSAEIDRPISVTVTSQDDSATTADGDYNAVTTVVTFPANSTTAQTASVNINSDNKVEADETFSMALSSLMSNSRNVTLGTITGTGTITNDDSATLTFSGGTAVAEGDNGTTTPMTFEATLDNPVQGGFTVAHSAIGNTATAGDDFAVLMGGSLTFAGTAGETQSFNVVINGDNAVEADETFTATLGTLAGSTLTNSITVVSTPQIGTILNDDVDIEIAAVDADKDEGDSGLTPFTFVVSRTTDSGINSVRYDVSGVGSADIDNPSGIVNFVATEMSKTLTINVKGDLTVEADEPFTVTLSSATRSVDINTAIASGVIRNDDDATVTIISVTDVEADGPFVFDVVLSAEIDTPISVTVNSADNTATTADGDYNGVSTLVTFPPNSTTSQRVSVNVNDDSKVEADETFSVTLSSLITNSRSVTLDASTAVGTIENDDSAILTLSGAAAQKEGDSGNSTMAFDVTLNSDVQGFFSVDYGLIDNTALAFDDYQPTGNSLTFSGVAGETKPISVTIIGDRDVEADETFTVTLGTIRSSLDISTAGSPQTGTILNDDDDAGIADIQASNFEGDSGTTPLTFVISRTGFDSGESLAYTVSGFGADPADPNDFVGGSYPSGTITFGAGLTTTLTISVAGDTTIESGELFMVTLTQATRSLDIVADTVIGAIINDDTASITVSDVTVDEGAGTAAVTVTLSAEAEHDAQLQYSTSQNTAEDGADYTGQSGTATITAGMTQTVITIPITDDLTIENTETFTVSVGLTSVTARGGLIDSDDGIVTILDNDEAMVTLSSASPLLEGDSGSTADYVFTATLDLAVDGGFTIAYVTDGNTATAGSDFVDNDSTLTFAGMAGETHTITVTVNGDNDVEADETFSVTLGAISGTTLDGSISLSDSPQVGNILNDDVDIAIAALDADKDEGDSSVTPFTFTVSRTTDIGVNAVDYRVTGGDSADFVTTSGTVDFAIGQMSKTLTIFVNGDRTVEADEPFTVTLSSPMRSVEINTVSANGVIRNDDAATLSINDVSVDEGDVGTQTATFEVTLDAAVDVSLTVKADTANHTATAADGDYIAVTGQTLAFTGSAGETQIVSVTINGDETVELDESFFLNLSDISASGRDVSLADAQGEGEIENDDDAVITIGSVSGSESGGNQTVAITLSAAADVPVTVTVSTEDGSARTSDSDYEALTQVIVFASGEVSKSAEITINDDDKVEADEQYAVNLVSLDNAGRNITLGGPGSGIIVNDDAVTVSIADVTVDEGVGSAMVTVTLSAESDFPVSAAYASSAGTATVVSDYSDVNGLLTFAPGVTQTTILIPIVDDDLDEPAETVDVTISGVTNATIADGAAILTIADNDAAVALSIAGTIVPEEVGIAYVTVTLSAVSGFDVGVDFASANATAIAPNDYVATSGRVTITAGMTQTTIPVTINNDAITEGDETLTITLSNPSHATVAGVLRLVTIRNAVATVTITDSVDETQAGIVVTPTHLMIREDESAEFTISLKTEPAKPVTITVSSDDTSECTVSPLLVVLDASNWQDGLPLTVSGVEDGLSDGTQTCTIVTARASSMVSVYNGINPDDVEVNVASIINVVFLPIVMNNFTGAPDLVVESIDFDGDDVQVVIKNIGEGPVRDGFWVDLLVNPPRAPLSVNDVVETLPAEGLVWGITVDLAVGETLTLTYEGLYYDEERSTFEGYIESGDVLYGQVDSAHRDIPPYGGVRETHEIRGEPYNNIRRIVVP